MDIFLTYRIHDDDNFECHMNYNRSGFYDLELAKQPGLGEIAIFASAKTLLQVADKIYAELGSEISKEQMLDMEEA